MRSHKTRVRHLVATSLLIAASLVLYSGKGRAQGALPVIVMQPGQSQIDLGLNKIEIVGDRVGEGSVNVSSPNRVAMWVRADFCHDLSICRDLDISWGRQTATRRAQMYRDFCVPNPGANDCASGVSDPPEDLVATVSFDAERIWKFLTFASGTASLKVNAQIIDLDNGNRRVAYQTLEDASQGSFLGKVKVIAKVPVPLPELDDETVVQPVVFTIRLRRGHEHRLIFTVTAAADSGIRPLGEGQMDMLGNIIGSSPGGITVRNLSIAIGQSTDDRFTALENRVKALEDNAADVPVAVEAQSMAFDEKVGGLSGGVNDLTLDLENVKASLQETQTAMAGMKTQVGTLETNVGTLGTNVGVLQTEVATMQIKFDGHTHDCVLLRPGHDDAKDRGRRGAKDDDRPGFGGQFTISCAAPKQPAPAAKKR